MPIIALALLFCSCSPKPVDHNNVLPRYSEMGAASDLGKVKSE